MRLSGLFGLCTSVAKVPGATTVLAHTPEPETRQSILESAAAEKATSLQPYIRSHMRTESAARRQPRRLTTPIAVIALLGVTASAAVAQTPEPSTRQAAIETAQAEKVPALHTYVPPKAERVMGTIQTYLDGTVDGWHPYLQSAYRGGGFALGAGYRRYVSAYNTIDVRGSYTVSSYKLVEAEFVAPRLFLRRGQLSVLGGWRDATQVGYFGTGTTTSVDDRTNFAFRQPYASARLTLLPIRKLWTVQGGAEWTRWSQRPGEGTFPSVETKYTPATLPGLGAETTYLHAQGGVGFDWRTSQGYSRRGGVYDASFHDFTDRDSDFGFRRVDYEVIQHVPILREAWVLSLRGKASTTFRKDDQEVPFFMLPALGGGSDLRGFASWRFRDRHSLLLQAEWRIIANRFLETAFFYDAGKVASRINDLDLDGMKSDYGIGVRFHGPFATPLRIDLARSNEKRFALVFSSTASF
jgi:hypothetical protein